MPDTPPPTNQTSVLFICLGNICRSPLAEGIFTSLVTQRNLTHNFRIDSCGTGHWHVGNPPDPRSVLVAAKNNIDITHLRARQYHPKMDPESFDLLIPMDNANARDIIDLGAPEHKVKLIRTFDPTLEANTTPDVPDPYYGGDSGFDHVHDMLLRACTGLLDHLGH